MIHRILSSVFANSLMLYIISKYIPSLGLKIDYVNWFSLEILLLLWLIFWVIYDMIRYIFKILAFPINFLTLWLLWILINVWFLYLFVYMINAANIWIKMWLWWFFMVLILSIVIALFNLLFKKL